MRISGGGKLSLDGFDAAHPLRVTLDGVVATDAPPVQVRVKNAHITTGPGEVNFRPAGEGVLVHRVADTRKVGECGQRFVPFPVVATVSSR